MHFCIIINSLLMILLLTDVYGEYVKYAPVFGKTDVEKLMSFINEYIKYGDNKG